MVAKKLKSEWLGYENQNISILNRDTIIIDNQTVKTIDIINQTIFFKNGSVYKLKEGDTITPTFNLF